MKITQIMFYMIILRNSNNSGTTNFSMISQKVIHDILSTILSILKNFAKFLKDSSTKYILSKKIKIEKKIISSLETVEHTRIKVVDFSQVVDTVRTVV